MFFCRVNVETGIVEELVHACKISEYTNEEMEEGGWEWKPAVERNLEDMKAQKHEVGKPYDLTLWS